MTEYMELSARMLVRAKRDLDAAKTDHAAAVKAMQGGGSDIREAHETVRQAHDDLVTAAESRGDVEAAAETLREARRELRRLTYDDNVIKADCAALHQRVTQLEAAYRSALERVEDAALEMVEELTDD